MKKKNILALGLVILLAAGAAQAGVYDAYKMIFGERSWHLKYNGFLDAVANGALSLTVPEIDHIGNYSNSLDTAVAGIGSARKILLINTTATVNPAGGTLTVPETLQLWVSREGDIQVATGKTLVVNNLNAGLYQIFSCAGTGKVVFGPGAVQAALPEWWGAKGDGATDSTVASQSALTSQAGVIQFSAGEYVIDAEISIFPVSNTNIIINRGATLSAKGTASDSHQTIYCRNAVSNILINGGGAIKGVRNNATKPEEGADDGHGHGIKIANASNIVIRDITIYDCWGDGIYIGTNNVGEINDNLIIANVKINSCRRNGVAIAHGSNILIDGSYLYSMGRTVSASGYGTGVDIEPNPDQAVSRVTITGNQIYNCYQSCISAAAYSGGASPVEAIKINNNTLTDNAAHTTRYMIYGASLVDSIIMGNTITGGAAAGGGSIYACYSPGVPIVGLVIGNNIVKGNYAGPGICVNGDPEAITLKLNVSNNVVESATTHGIHVQHALQPVVLGNTLKNSGQRGISLYGCESALVKANQVAASGQTTDDTYDNIHVSACVDSGVINNICRRGGGAAQPKYGINISAGSGNSVAGNNLITAGKTAPFKDSGTGTTLLDNRLSTDSMSGYITLTAANSFTVNNGNVHAGTRLINLYPVNAAAATLMGSAKHLYLRTDTIVPGVSFELRTGDTNFAAGGEAIYYVIRY